MPTQSVHYHRLSKNAPTIFTFRFQVLEPIKRSFKASTNRIINKTLKQSVTSSRIKPLPHGVCRNTSKPVPTRSPRCVESLSILSRRISTVGSPKNLERRYYLSKIKNLTSLHLLLPPSRFVSQLKVGDDIIWTFVLLSLNISIMPIMSISLDFRHLAISRQSISILSLLMQHVSLEYMLCLTFVTSHFVLRHPILDVTPQTRGSVDYPSTCGIKVDVGLPDATLENRAESPLNEELYQNTIPANTCPKQSNIFAT